MRRDNYNLLPKKDSKFVELKSIRWCPSDIKKIDEAQALLNISEFSDTIRFLTNIGIERIIELKQNGTNIEEIKAKRLLERLNEVRSS